VRLVIEDDGRGLSHVRSPNRERPSLGMVSMKARARYCGGELTVSEVKPQGVRVAAVVPLRLA
jgi:signal transduction histidine kinase